jgi:hypothetical protein
MTAGDRPSSTDALAVVGLCGFLDRERLCWSHRQFTLILDSHPRWDLEGDDRLTRKDAGQDAKAAPAGNASVADSSGGVP